MAVAALERARDIQLERLGEDHPALIYTLRLLGQAELEIGHGDRGRGHIGRAAAIGRGTDLDPRGTSLAVFAHAPAVVEGGERARALRLAREAADLLDPDVAADRGILDEIEDFVAEHDE